MRKIVYYVASTLDGFISGPDEDISKFVGSGNGVEKYLRDLQRFDTVIMGKNTYEFGYKFGLKPGERAYAHMTHYIFSNSLVLPNTRPGVYVKRINIDEISAIQEQPGTDIYLCGGGQFAGWLLDNKKIDVLKIKLNPVVLGEGVKLFGDSRQSCKTELVATEQFDHGLQIMTFNMIYE